jgi:hypothetical protein
VASGAAPDAVGCCATEDVGAAVVSFAGAGFLVGWHRVNASATTIASKIMSTTMASSFLRREALSDMPTSLSETLVLPHA